MQIDLDTPLSLRIIEEMSASEALYILVNFQVFAFWNEKMNAEAGIGSK